MDCTDRPTVGVERLRRLAETDVHSRRAVVERRSSPSIDGATVPSETTVIGPGETKDIGAVRAPNLDSAARWAWMILSRGGSSDARAGWRRPGSVRRLCTPVRRTAARRGTLGWLLPLGLLLFPQSGVLANMQGIDRADNRIVFSGEVDGADREAHRRLRFEDAGGDLEAYEARWTARGERVPLLRLRLRLLAPGGSYRIGEPESVEQQIRTHPLFRRLAFTAVEAGTAESELGPAEYLVFRAGRHRCGVFRLYLSRNAGSEADVLGDMLMTALYCPVSHKVDAARLSGVLSRVGIRGIAVPETDPVEVPSARSREDALAGLVRSGDMQGLRRVAASGLDPDRVIPFSQTGFAGGRTLRRPMLMAASLFGHVEMTVFLLHLGAAAHGRAAGAICAAIARDHPEIVKVLLEANPALAGYGRCGRRGGLTALEVARRLDRTAIVELLRGARSR